MRACFVDAGEALAAVARRLRRESDPALEVNLDPDIAAERVPEALDGAEIAVIDHTALPVEQARRAAGLRHVVFLGTGARSYMDPEALRRECGVEVHVIKGYGDTAVAEMAFALMWAAAKGLARMDGGIRAGGWPRTDGIELTGKTVGLLGFGGIAAEMARLCRGAGLRVLAWNRTPREAEGVEFVGLDELLARSDVLSVHLLLNDGTRGFLGRERLARMKPGAILVNTARGAVVDEAALADALREGRLGHAALDVFAVEPLPPGHELSTLPNALDHCRRLAADPGARGIAED